MTQRCIRQVFSFFFFPSLVFCVWLLAGRVSGQTTAPAQTGAQTAPEPLAMGQALERPLAMGQHSYFLLELRAGQLVKLEVEQLGIDFYVNLSGPGGEAPPPGDREPWPHGTEVRWWETTVSGTYRVDLHAYDSVTPAGRFVIRWTEVKQPTERERTQVKASGLCTAAIQHLYKGEFDAGIKLAEESLALRESLQPPDQRDLIESLFWLIRLLQAKTDLNNHERVQQLFARQLSLREQAFGFDHPKVAHLLNDIANGSELPRAIELFERAAQILEKHHGPYHHGLGVVLSNFAIKLEYRGDDERAEAMYKRAAAIREKVVGPDDSNLAQSLNNLGSFYLLRDKYEDAEPLLQRALAIWTKAHGLEHERTSHALENLGLLFQRKGDFARAEPLLRQTLEIRLKVMAPNNMLVGAAHYGLGKLYLEMGDDVRAEESLRRAQAVRELQPSVWNNELADLLLTRTRLALVRGRQTEALDSLQRAAKISESRLNDMLAFGSDEDKLDFLKTFAEETNVALNLHARFAPQAAQALQLALTTWLQRKGRVLDEMNRSLGFLRSTAGAAAAPLFKQLLTKQGQLSRLATAEQSSDETKAQIRQLNQEIGALQATISARSAAFRTQVIPPATIDAVRAALPPGAALTEFAQYQPENLRTKKKAAPRYLAYVVLQTGALGWRELGAAAEIDEAVQTFRQALAAPRSAAGLRTAARTLDERLMQPLRPLLGQTRQVFLAPEGALNLVPFAALLDERQRYLLTRYHFTYLTSGRDLLRLQIKHQSTDDVLVFAAPDYDDSGAGAAPTAGKPAPPDDGRRGRRSRSAPARERFEALAYAGAEAQAIRQSWPQAQLFLGRQALESALKQVKRPQLLHIVTHGVFLTDQQSGAFTSLENPLLRSWLALAGANQRRSGPDGAEDGILTAYEAAALDLWGTKLVVLSACETGLGEVKNGEGVYGLRRALVLAGAETQLTSLWRIDDRVTRNLMKSYYARLRAGVGRVEALRQVQLELLNSQANRHPYYWAGFIALGEWANLAGRR